MMCFHLKQLECIFNRGNDLDYNYRALCSTFNDFAL